MADLSLPRELGSDVSVVCAECGTKRELAISEYGSTSPKPCAKCAEVNEAKPGGDLSGLNKPKDELPKVDPIDFVEVKV